MDSVFGVRHYRNEITWKRKTGRGETSHKSNRFGVSTDILLFYAKSNRNVFEAQYNPEAKGYQEYVTKFFSQVSEDGRRYAIDNLASPSPRPNLMYEYKGYKPPKFGWAITKEKMERWDKEGKLHFPKSKDGRIRRKRYADELKGRPIQNLWDDIEMVSSRSRERLGFPTQKPESLLERIIKASSKKGDIVLDPFCGCGTTITVAQKLKRKWIGIDVTHLAISLMKHRLKDTFGNKVEFEVIGEPVDLKGAEELAKQDPYQFQWWALGLVGARPAESEKKKGKDRGIDGYIYFHDEPQKTKKIVIQIKSGHVNPGQIRDLRGVIERENAQIGVFITLANPTQGMTREAVTAGFYNSPGWGKDYPRLQMLTIEELLRGKGIEYPPKTSVTFKKAERYKANEHEQLIIEEKAKEEED